MKKIAVLTLSLIAAGALHAQDNDWRTQDGPARQPGQSQQAPTRQPGQPQQSQQAPTRQSGQPQQSQRPDQMQQPQRQQPVQRQQGPAKPQQANRPNDHRPSDQPSRAGQNRPAAPTAANHGQEGHALDSHQRPHEMWKAGERVPQIYHNNNYYITDYSSRRLPEPPAGQRWMHVNGDYVLVNIATNVIVRILTGQY